MRDKLNSILLIVFFGIFFLFGNLMMSVVYADDRTNEKYYNKDFKLESLPNISFITDFYYSHRTVEDEKIKDSKIPTLMEKTSSGGVAERGFAFRYSELVIDALLRENIFLFGSLRFTEDSAYIGETYFSARNLPAGFILSAGKMYSNFGRLNIKHDYEQDFCDIPLIYFSFFGSNKLIENGLRIVWPVPVQFRMNLGVEILEGDNELSFGTKQIGTSDGKIKIAPSGSPNLGVLFIDTYVSLDSMEIGLILSGAFGRSRFNNSLQSNSGNAIEGDTVIAGTSFLLKYYYSEFQYISLELEAMMRSLNGTQYEPGSQAADPISKNAIKRMQYGGFAQLIVQPLSRLRFGMRFSMIAGSETINQENGDKIKNNVPNNLFVASGLVSCAMNTYSRLRLQYNYDITKYNSSMQKYQLHEIYLDCTFAFGSQTRFL